MTICVGKFNEFDEFTIEFETADEEAVLLCVSVLTLCVFLFDLPTEPADLVTPSCFNDDEDRATFFGAFLLCLFAPLVLPDVVLPAVVATVEL